MGILWEIARSLTNPVVWMSGLGLGLLLHLQSTRMVYIALAGLVIWSAILLVSRFEVDVNHGKYAYQYDRKVWLDAHMNGVDPAVANPMTIAPEAAHLAGVQLGGAAIAGTVTVCRNPEIAGFPGRG